MLSVPCSTIQPCLAHSEKVYLNVIDWHRRVWRFRNYVYTYLGRHVRGSLVETVSCLTVQFVLVWLVNMNEIRGSHSYRPCKQQRPSNDSYSTSCTVSIPRVCVLTFPDTCCRKQERVALADRRPNPGIFLFSLTFRAHGRL